MVTRATLFKNMFPRTIDATRRGAALLCEEVQNILIALMCGWFAFVLLCQRLNYINRIVSSCSSLTWCCLIVWLAHRTRLPTCYRVPYIIHDPSTAICWGLSQYFATRSNWTRHNHRLDSHRRTWGYLCALIIAGCHHAVLLPIYAI